MNTLLDKYKNDALTPEELFLLRGKIKTEDTAELEKELLEDWLSFQTREPDSDKEVNYEQIWQRIEQDTRKVKPSFRWKYIWQYAAILLLPLLLFSTFYFYREATIVAQQEMVVETQQGERANITLPDGTSVYLNTESKLTYNPAEFNQDTRAITFEGEAYFQVKKDREKPFSISSQNIQVNVLGTEFNLHSRKNQDSLVVILKKGHVLLAASTQQQELFENETAIFDKRSGTFSVEKDLTPTIHWIQKELLFKNTPLSELLTIIEAKYNVHIHLSGGEQWTNDKFSGTLPANDLVSVLEILRKSYQCDYVIRANQIQITFPK